MTPDILLTLVIIVIAIILFATEKLRVDVVALLVLLTLSLTGLVSTEEAFSGFSNTAVITVWAVFIVSGALFKTGVADILGRGILRLAGNREPQLILVIMLTCGVMSAFMNNVGATAMLLPAVVGIARETKVPVSKLLIPLSFSSLLGGKMTLIGTPANILATSILLDRGLESFEFFEFAPIGIIVLTTGIIYMLLIGRHLLPDRKTGEEQEAASELRKYVSEVRVKNDSPLVGKTLAQSTLGSKFDLTVIAIQRDNEAARQLRRDRRFKASDLVLVSGSVDNLMRAVKDMGLEIESERALGTSLEESDQVHIIEATLSPNSHIVGLSLRESRFRDQYGFTALAIWRHGELITERLADVKLRFGDALLLQGPKNRQATLQDAVDFLVLEPVPTEIRREEKAPIAVAVMIGVLALVIFGSFHISTAMVIGAVLMVLTGSLTMDEAYASIDWRTVFLVAGMLPLGIAMQSTGAAAFLADTMLSAVGGYGPIAVLGGIYVLAALITQPMSNAAAMVLVVPIALDTAAGLGASHLPFAMATIIGAATSFLSPVGHKANVLVFGPGGYRFIDYTRVGIWLTLVLLIVSMFAIPLLWPLFP
jgi:di/tricarboxylate transporter